MIKIYNIIDKNGLRYIGKTKQKYLSNRLAQHRCAKKLNSDCSSRELDLDNCVIMLIEECSEERCKDREQFWINCLKCVNKNDTTINYEKRKKYQKKYYEEKCKNNEKRKQYQKQYQKEYYHKNKDLKKNLAKE